MSAGEHERIEELISAEALGGLGPAQAAELAAERDRHGADCEICRTLGSDYAEVAGRLGFALDPRPMRSGSEDQLMARIEAEAPTTETPSAPARPVGHRPSRVWRGVAAVAAAIALFFGGWFLRSATSSSSTFDVAKGRVVTFEPAGPGRQGTLAVVYRPGHAGAYILGDQLEPLPQGKVYEVWMFQGTKPRPGGCLAPRSDGTLSSYVDANLGSTRTMAVTVEPSSCPSAPTSQPILTANLS